MYSNQTEYFTTLEFTTVNKPLWTQVFNKKEHHDLRKELGVTYAGYSSNRKNENDMSVIFKYNNKDTMKNHSDKIHSLMDENREKWSALGDLDSVKFDHWKILCERTNDIRFDDILNKTNDIFWSARHSVGDKKQWVNAMKTQQQSGSNFDVRWWGLMENINNPDEVCCVYRIPRDRLEDFLLNFTESMTMMHDFATIDVNKVTVKFLNVEWETMYNTPVSMKTIKAEEEIRNIITDMATLKDGKMQGDKYMTDSCVFIRPSGNPLSKTAWQAMMDSPDVSVTHSSLVAINKVEVVGEMAYACYTTHGKFNYKGTENDDIAVLTAIFRKIDSEWKVVHGQRSTGRKPEDPAPQF